MKARKNSKPLSAEQKIVEGLENFADALENCTDDQLKTRFTCRKVRLNLEPFTYTPEMVKALRGQLGLSQALFAKFLGASKSLVQAWERGDREPKPMACRFMDEIATNPDLFKKRFASLATPTAGAC